MKSKLKVFKISIGLFLCTFSLIAQQKIEGYVINEKAKPISTVIVYDDFGNVLASTDSKGYFEFFTAKKQLTLLFYADEFKLKEQVIFNKKPTTLKIVLEAFSEQLSEIEIKARKRKIFELKHLKDVEETAIYAGKKTEVVLVSQSLANLASNNARQIYSQVAGLNIYENDDAGLQLNIGGRGLDPNRTANFNTRQNGYDISADVLGYPESYYTPPAESLQEIQIIRGAASLQYGTQFGGLVNFILNKPNVNKSFELITRNTLGSNNLYTNFTSIGGTRGNFGYYGFYNYKKGDGFRPNSIFESHNIFAYTSYLLSDATKISLEFTHLNYLAQQAGGLTDQMFYDNPYQSNRSRNWFKINWLLYNLKLSHQFSKKTNFTFLFYGLEASRDAIGFRTNRVNQVDSNNERDLLKGTFSNFAIETRLLSKYHLFNKEATFLVGMKLYKAKNTNEQGPGSNNNDADFRFYYDEYPNYPNQSKSIFPNFNLALFGENILYLNKKWSITPGVRFEYINTKRDEIIKDIITDAAGNVINENLREEKDTKERKFALLGLGVSFKQSKSLEFYGNISQNYRSVTFSDISTANPAFEIADDIDDEKGFSTDLGIRGNMNSYFSYDINAFGLFYFDRINIYTRSDGKAERANIGDARIIGIESLIDFNLKSLLTMSSQFSLNYFINTSLINSVYTQSKINGVKGNKLEFVPDINFKTGIKFGYKNLLSNIQFSYLSEQFSDATNATQGSISGVTGQFPSYSILDLSFSYKYKKIKLETGVNNLLNKAYFTRRATGYPGPGIIPSSPRNWYSTLSFQF